MKAVLSIVLAVLSIVLGSVLAVVGQVAAQQAPPATGDSVQVGEDSDRPKWIGAIVGFTVGAGVGYLLGPAMGFEDSPGTPDKTVQTNCRPSLGESPICDSVFIKGEQAMSAKEKGSIVGSLVLGTAGYFVGSKLSSRWSP